MFARATSDVGWFTSGRFAADDCAWHCEYPIFRIKKEIRGSHEFMTPAKKAATLNMSLPFYFSVSKRANS